MIIRLFNTLSRRKEIFRPLRKKTVTLYTCGPTVYDYAHIGNLRTFIFEDILKRVLIRAGYNVRHVMNITDVDDKTIRGARKSHMALPAFTRIYEKAFKDDLQKLNILSPSRFIRATDHISTMLSVIETLLRKKIAYTRDGSVYFDISSFPNYGKLARIKQDALQHGAGMKVKQERVDDDEYAKDEARDFALWKARKGNEPFWQSPFGKGRPGWHIECSAMAVQYLGQPIDIHAGGVDLLFPHHENEIAQAEAAAKKQFVRYWLHGKHLLVAGQKMSKSLGNIFTLRDIEAEKTTPVAFRYLVLGAHYRSPLNFTWEGLAANAQSLERLYDFLHKLRSTSRITKTNTTAKTLRTIQRFQKQFDDAISDDLSVPQALGVLWNCIHEYNKNPEKFNAKEVVQTLYDWDTILGLDFTKQKMEKIPSFLKKLLKEREAARGAHDFAKADKIRTTIRSLGWEIEDTPDGPHPHLLHDAIPSRTLRHH